MNTIRFHIIGNKHGAAMIFLITTILIMSVLGAAMLNLTSTSTLGQVSANHMDRAYFMAEAGGNYALGIVKDDIESDGKYDDTYTIHNQTFILNDSNKTEEGRFRILVDDKPKFTIITSIGSINVQVSTGIETKIIYHMNKSFDKKHNVIFSDPPIQHFSK